MLPIWKFPALFLGGDILEKLLASFVIPMDPKAKKNSHRISGCGRRCPVCGKYEKQFIRNGSATVDFSFLAVQYLNPKPKNPIDYPIHIVYKLYTQTRRRVDDLNLYENLDDILVTGYILKDDNRNIIRSRDGSRVLYDKQNPRAEIYIYTYEEEGDNAIK